MAGSKGFADTRVHTGDRQVDSIQQARQEVAQVANACPFLRGKLLTGLTFAAGAPRIVNHRLGYRASGYFVVRNYGADVSGTVGETGTVAPDPKNQIWLISSVNATFDVWVF